MDAHLDQPGAAGPEDVTAKGAAAITAPCCGGGCTCCHAMLSARQELRRLQQKLAAAERAETAAWEAARQAEERFEAEQTLRLAAERALAEQGGREGGG